MTWSEGYGYYSFNRTLAPRCWFDVEAFEAELAEAHKEQGTAPSEATAHLRAAMQLYRGNLFGDLPVGDWHIVRREELKREYLDGLLWLAQLLYAQADYPGAIEAYHKAIQADPYLEGAHRGLMASYACQSERSQALASASCFSHSSYIPSLSRRIQ